MAHGYLPSQFLSASATAAATGTTAPWSARLRFSLEVLQAVRDAVGDHMAVSVRLSADELAPGGLGVEQSAEIAARLHGERARRPDLAGPRPLRVSRRLDVHRAAPAGRPPTRSPCPPRRSATRCPGRPC